MQTCYAPFIFELYNFLIGKTPYENEDEKTLIFLDKTEAFEIWNKYKTLPGRKMSNLGCGPNFNQFVRAPICTGIITLNIDEAICNKQMIKINPKWIQQIHFHVGKDVAHEELTSLQIINGKAPNYSFLRPEMQRRFDSLCHLCEKIALSSQDARRNTDFTEEYARKSLKAVYNHSGLMHQNFEVYKTMSLERKRFYQGMKYLQCYIKAVETHLDIDSIVRHVHFIEDSFKSSFQSRCPDCLLFAAEIISDIMQKCSERAVNNNEQMTFIALKADADKDILIHKEMK